MAEPAPISRFDRAEKLLGDLDIAQTQGIEIGALANPILRRPAANIRYVDHADQAALRAKYAGDRHVVADDIVPVDAIWGDNTLAQCFPGERFDYAIASHVAEHVPDLIGWLDETATILRPDGRLILALPDRRYCFDVLRRETSLADIIDHHLRGVRRPTPGQIFDCSANAVDFDHTAAWSPSPPAVLRHFVTQADALAQARESLDGRYIDGHCSVFTARSLLHLLDDLLALHLLPFRLDRFHIAPVGTAEMILVLRRQPPDRDDAAARATIGRLLREGVDSEGLTLDFGGEACRPAAREDPRVEALEHALAEMRASTSWRVTAPMRALSRVARRIGSRPRSGIRLGGALHP